VEAEARQPPDRPVVVPLGEELEALGPKIDALMVEWEGIEREIAEAESEPESR